VLPEALAAAVRADPSKRITLHFPDEGKTACPSLPGGLRY